MGRITIIGLGRIGTSIGLALRQAKLNNEIIGHDRDFSIAGAAKRAGALDKAEWNLPAALDNAGLVVIATPLAAVEQVMKEIAPHLMPGAVITDTASAKLPVLRWADQYLPIGVSFVGGHPILRQTGGKDASARLFDGSTYAICAAPNVDSSAIELVCGMVSVLNAKTLFLDAAEHDSFITLTEHIPMLASTLVARVALSSPAWRETGRVATGVFRDSVALAEGDPAARREAVMSNREEMKRGILAMEEQLRQLRTLLDEGNAAELEQYFDHTREELLRWEAQSHRYDGSIQAELADAAPSISPGGGLGQLFLGGSRGRKGLFGRGKKDDKK